jgi:hypothetical protein
MNLVAEGVRSVMSILPGACLMLAARLPDPLVQRGSLCFEQWADNLDLALAGIEHGPAGQIPGWGFPNGRR